MRSARLSYCWNAGVRFIKPLSLLAAALALTECIARKPVTLHEVTGSTISLLNAPKIEVAFTDMHQSISGFGASSAWTSRDLSDSMADQLFSVEKGVGLSLLRVRITPGGVTDEMGTARKAVARGATVWGAPWSPPGEWKTSGTDRHGGALKPEHYQDWADRLVRFAQSMQNAGLPLLALSAQNEPNWKAEWETCEWSPAELARFVREHLGPTLERSGLRTRVLAPETIDWLTLEKYAEPLLSDPDARKYLGFVATHSYGGTAFAYASPREHGLELWETEVSDNEHGRNPGMDSGLRVAELLSSHLTIANVSAWHYWWITPLSSSNQKDNPAITENGRLSRRAYAMGNWSKFVRPGFVRVTATPEAQGGVTVTAFRDPNGRGFAVVAINTNDADTARSVALTGLAAASVTPWVTSPSLELKAQTALDVVAGAFSFALPARSVTTFVGTRTDN